MQSSHSWKRPEGSDCWTVDQYAARYQVDRSTVYNWLRDGLLQSAKIGGSRRILPEHDAEFRKRWIAA